MAEDVKVESPKKHVDKAYTVPRFKSSIVKQIKDPKDMYPQITASILKYYDLENETQRTKDKKPYIIFLNEIKVGQASTKQKTEFIKSVGAMVMMIIAIFAVVILAGLLIASGVGVLKG